VCDVDENKGLSGAAIAIIAIGLVALLFVVIFGVFAVVGMLVFRARATAPPPPPTIAPPVTVTVTTTLAPPPPPPTVTPVPSISAASSAPQAFVAPTGNIPNVERTVRSLQPRFRNCYNKGLATDPTIAGKIVLSVNVQADGDVASVTKTSGSGLPASVESCIIRAVQNAHFDAPFGGAATLNIPIAFQKAE